MITVAASPGGISRAERKEDKYLTCKPSCCNADNDFLGLSSHVLPPLAES